MHQWLPQSGPETAFSFHHISVLFSGGAGSTGPDGDEPVAEAQIADDTFKSQEPKRKSVYVRKEFPEAWLWTEEMVK